jgi:N-acyl-D-glutamate deacylase
VAISELPLEGDVVIDATGHVVSPGFIDFHAYGQNIGDYRLLVMQGVTTALELETGLLPISDWYDLSVLRQAAKPRVSVITAWEK